VPVLCSEVRQSINPRREELAEDAQSVRASNVPGPAAGASRTVFEDEINNIKSKVGLALQVMTS
jgi:hypothetical protein